MNLAQFHADPAKCVGCGRCAKVCPGGLLFLDESRKAKIQDHSSYGWNGCWRCQHCLAVCPVGAISVLGRRPEDSAAPLAPENAASFFASLVVNRHSCRRYLDRNVPGETIQAMLDLLACAPNGGNKQQVEFTLIDDKKQMEWFRRLACSRMETLTVQGIYPDGFDKTSYEDMKRWEDTVRPDMLFCGAPHLLIPHAPLGQGTPVQDVIIAATYFELLCASHGLGTVLMTFPLDAMKNMPEVWSLLGIPEGHYVGMLIGFGFPEIPYARGVQKSLEPERVNRPVFGEGVSGC